MSEFLWFRHSFLLLILYEPVFEELDWENGWTMNYFALASKQVSITWLIWWLVVTEELWNSRQTSKSVKCISRIWALWFRRVWLSYTLIIQDDICLDHNLLLKAVASTMVWTVIPVCYLIASKASKKTFGLFRVFHFRKKWIM